MKNLWGEKEVKKVIQFIPTLSDGGAETLVKDYATLTDKSKIDTVVVTAYPFENTANYLILKDAKIKIVSIYQHWNIKSKLINRLFPEFYKKRRIKKIIQEENPDVIHVHMWLLRYLKGLKKELGYCKVFYTCHSLPERYFTGNLNCEYNAAKWLFKNTDFRLIALHEKMRAELNKMFSVDNTVVVRNGIDFKRFKSLETTKEKKREELNILKESYLVGHIGRYVKEKNHEFILDIFVELVKIKQNAHLLLIGNGPNEIDIKKRIVMLGLENNVTMLSHRSDVPELLQCMDVFLFPSLYEGLGIALIEAQVCGLPCVVSNKIPSDAYISNNITELSLELSAKDWAEIVANPKCNIESWGDMENYDMSSVIRNLEELYLG